MGDFSRMRYRTPDMDERMALTEAPAGRPVMRQRWSGLLFVHWAVDAALIAERIPAGLHVDTFDGKAWLGAVPFFMERIRPTGLPPVPWLSWFMELNVRTYVHDGKGNAGVWFFSLDCNQPVAVEIARRSFHLPYQHARMRSRKTGDHVQYHCKRKTTGAVEAVYEYELPETTARAERGSLEWFLVERYLLFSSNPAGKIFTGRVHHPPYQIAAGKCGAWSTEPLRLDGLPVPPGPPDSILTAAPLEVRIFPLRRN